MKFYGSQLFRSSLLLLSVVLLTNGCSSAAERRAASGNFDYLEVKPVAPLKVPEGLNQPDRSNEYAVADLEQAGAAFGRDLDVRAPAQVLPLVAGSSVTDEQGKISLNFDLQEVGASADVVRDEVWSVLWEYFYDNGIRARFWDKQNGVLITEWFHTDVQLSEDNSFFDTLTFREKVIHVRQRYLFNFDVNERGTRATLGATLLGHEETIDNRLLDGEVNDTDKRRYTVNLLNGAIGHYEFKKRVDAHERDQQKYKPVTLVVGKDASGLPAFIASAEFDRTWERLALVITELGFTIEDRNKSLGTYFVRYEGSQSLWDAIWGDGIDIDIPKDQYQILLGDLGDKTSITLLSIDNKPVGKDRLAEIYQALSDAMERGEIK